LLARAALPVMHAQGRGTIINVSSIAGRIGTPTTSIYNATKFGLDGFSQALRREVLAQGIQVCVIYPGPTAGTEFSQHARPGSSRLHLRRFPWMYTSTDTVGRAIVALADRPRARRVVPGLFAPIIALNTLWPWLADVVVARAAAKARRG
jgi:short-subunit dehydrogenase